MADPTWVSITHATEQDVPEILAMIKELAAHEKCENKVEATEDSLRRTLTFPHSPTHQHGYAKALILRLPSEPTHAGDEPRAVAGMAVYFNNYSTWRSKPGVYLEDLFVRGQYRKRGYGKMLITALAQEVMRVGGARLEWCCLRSNTASLAFYDSLGAKQMTNWVSLRADGKELEDLALGRSPALKEDVNGA